VGVVSIELDELRTSVQKAFPASTLVGDRDASWRLVTEMGWLMTDLPEEVGGLELGRDAVCTIQFELGRVLASAPLTPALLGLQAISAMPAGPVREARVEAILKGGYIPMAMLPPQVTQRSDGRYDGRIVGVFEADMASHIVAGLPGLLALIPLDAKGVTVLERPVWDRSRRIFDVVLVGYCLDEDLVIATGDEAARLHDRISCNALLALASDALGGASAAFEMTVEYLRMRKQFDRPLAMFQALKHRCADMKVAIETANALLWKVVKNPAATLVDFGALKAHATEGYAMVVEEAIQLHGGIGLTAEYSCHLFMKRAMLDLQLWGSTDHWRARAGQDALQRFGDRSGSA
jgi:alkylation response protein AidB-like acyl-CoA dehydrogenase